MTGGDYLKLHLVYLGKHSENLQHDLLWHTQRTSESAVNSTRLDISAGCALYEMWRRKSYPSVLKSLRRKVGRDGFALIGRILAEGNDDGGGYMEVWLPNKPSLPPGVISRPLDSPDFPSTMDQLDGVYGGRSRIYPQDQEVIETRVTHGYSFRSGQFDIRIDTPLHKRYGNKL